MSKNWTPNKDIDMNEYIINRITKLEDDNKRLKQTLHDLHDFIACDPEFFEDFHINHSAYIEHRDNKTVKLTMHILSSAFQEATLDVPMHIIRQGDEAVRYYIVDNDDTTWTEWDVDGELSIEGFHCDADHDPEIFNNLTAHWKQTHIDKKANWKQSYIDKKEEE
jgi:hypothetical protein